MFSSGRSLIRALARRACPASRMAPLGSPAGFGLASRPGRRAGAVEEKLDVEGRARLSTVRIWHPKIVASRDQKPHHRRVLRDRGWRRLRQHGRRGNGRARATGRCGRASAHPSAAAGKSRLAVWSHILPRLLRVGSAEAPSGFVKADGLGQRQRSAGATWVRIASMTCAL
jgi:hypothetical protein